MAPLPVLVQGTLHRLMLLTERGNELLCHPVVTFLQFQGAVVMLILAAGWLWAGHMRRQELRRQQAQRLRSLSQAVVRSHKCAIHTSGGSATALDMAADDARWAGHGYSAVPAVPAKPAEATQAAGWPGVTLVLPVKGCRTHSSDSWRSQLAMQYDGPLEFLFVVDDANDPAYDAVQRVLDMAPKGSNARVLVSGPATSNSQKIHNLQAGIQAAEPSHKYALCLDDDVAMHPLSLQMLVEGMEANPNVFMATGYPFDIPPPHASVLTFCMLVYHLPLLIAFSLRQHTQFIWGGCMLFPLADLRNDRYGIMQAWTDGGYSDDLIVAAKCGEHSLPILCPSFSIYPQWLDAECGLKRYWNYLRRQLYVMDTYASPHNRRINHSMMVIHSYLSWAFVHPTTTALLRLLLWMLEILLMPTQQVWDGPGTSLQWLRMFGVAKCPLSAISHVTFLAGWGIAALALRWMAGVILDLFDELSPAAAPHPRDALHWAKLWLGFYINNAMLPCCMLYTKLCATVDWSGVRYNKAAGRVRRLGGESGNKFRTSARSR